MNINNKQQVPVSTNAPIILLLSNSPAEAVDIGCLLIFKHTWFAHELWRCI